MEHVLISAIGPSSWVRELGKSSSETSFSVLVNKRDDSIVTMVYPSKYPDKIWSLLFSLYIGDEVYLYVDRVDRLTGEIIICLDLLNKKNGHVFLHPEADRGLFDSIINGTVVEEYDEFEGDAATLREKLMETLPLPSVNVPEVIVDQAFRVKGVGTVILGFVMKGNIRKHQEMLVLPCNKVSTIRSIQIHDRDHDEAPAGARVGLAMKNIDPEDVPRGSLLIVPQAHVEVGDLLEMKVRTSGYWKDTIREGMRYHLCLSLQFVPFQLEGISGEGDDRIWKVRCESPVWHRKEDLVSLVYLDSGSFRVFGSGVVI